jgi:hypothetical protein
MKRVGILHGGVEIRQEEPSDEEVKHETDSGQVAQSPSLQPLGCRLRIVQL